VVSSILGTVRNHTEPCQESRETECHAWLGNPGSGVMNELGCVRPTAPVSCVELRHEDDRFLGSTPY
jgi:hypothetical protein